MHTQSRLLDVLKTMRETNAFWCEFFSGTMLVGNGDFSGKKLDLWLSNEISIATVSSLRNIFCNWKWHWNLQFGYQHVKTSVRLSRQRPWLWHSHQQSDKSKDRKCGLFWRVVRHSWTACKQVSQPLGMHNFKEKQTKVKFEATPMWRCGQTHAAWHGHSMRSQSAIDKHL